MLMNMNQRILIFWNAGLCGVRSKEHVTHLHQSQNTFLWEISASADLIAYLQIFCVMADLYIKTWTDTVTQMCGYFVVERYTLKMAKNVTFGHLSESTRADNNIS